MSYPESQVGYKPEDAAYAPQPPPSKRGCIFYGCITMLVLALLAVIAIALLAWMGLRYTNAMIEKYTSTVPITIKQVTLPEEEQKALDERLQVFKKAMDDGEEAELVLTGDELNALINKEEKVKGKVYVVVEGDKVSGDLSLPLPKLPIIHTEGRYFNGKATFTVSLRDGDLIVHAKELELNGQPLPPEINSQLTSQNLTKDFTNDPSNAEMVSKLEKIEIKDSKIYIKSRARKVEEEKKEEAEKKDEPEKNAAESRGTDAPPSVEEKKDAPAPPAATPKAEPAKAA